MSAARTTQSRRRSARGSVLAPCAPVPFSHAHEPSLLLLLFLTPDHSSPPLTTVVAILASLFGDCFFLNPSGSLPQARLDCGRVATLLPVNTALRARDWSLYASDPQSRSTINATFQRISVFLKMPSLFWISLDFVTTSKYKNTPGSRILPLTTPITHTHLPASHPQTGTTTSLPLSVR